jgi:hypothetical protein
MSKYAILCQVVYLINQKVFINKFAKHFVMIDAIF